MLKTPFQRLLRTLIFSLTVISGILLASCNNEDYYPKPRGYIRIDLPEHTYQPFDSTFPYNFDYSESARITFDEYTRQNPYWMNLDYPRYKGRIHISYKSIGGHNLYKLTEDAREMAFKHAPKAIGIGESFFSDAEDDVYGMTFRIEGRDAASPFQFYLTDSTDHFVRGALYFNVVPNNDSLQPVIDFIISDVEHMFDTFEWKK